jgi:hypothetical protein
LVLDVFEENSSLSKAKQVLKKESGKNTTPTNFTNNYPKGEKIL